MNTKIMKRSEFNPMDITLAYTTDDAVACKTEFVDDAYNQLSDSLIDDYAGDPADVDLDNLYDDMYMNFKLWVKASEDNVYEDSDAAVEDFVNFCRTGKLDECEGVQTSAEFQKMAPARKRKMIIQTSRKSLGKKDKYNTLGETKRSK